MFDRIKMDFQLGIVMLFGFCGVFALVPFAIYRFISGNYLAATLDSSLMALIVGMVFYGWRSGNIELAGKLLVVVNTIGIILSTIMLGVTGIFWAFVAISVNCFLTKSLRFAIFMSAIGMIILIVLGKGFENDAQKWSFAATSSLLGLLTVIIAQRNADQHARLAQLAAIDPLTGVLNRRTMEKELQSAIDEYSRTNKPMALIIFDLDYFKQVNDQHGHDEGDNVLKEFSALLQANTRSIDRIFRHGGEEFLLLLKNTTLPESRAVAEKIRIASEQSLRTPSGVVTVSCGVAMINKEQLYEQWVAHADAALYRAKNQGRNRVVCSD